MQFLSSLFSPSLKKVDLLLLCIVKPLLYLFTCLCNTVSGTLRSVANLRYDVPKRRKEKQDFAQILYNKFYFFY